jgi:hypothetical protein
MSKLDGFSWFLTKKAVNYIIDCQNACLIGKEWGYCFLMPNHKFENEELKGRRLLK